MSTILVLVVQVRCLSPEAVLVVSSENKFYLMILNIAPGYLSFQPGSPILPEMSVGSSQPQLVSAACN